MSASLDPKYPDVTVALIGGGANAMTIVGAVSEALDAYLRSEDMSNAERRAEVDAFKMEAYSGDYNHLIQTCLKWVNVE